MAKVRSIPPTRFAVAADGAGTVFLAGSFNDWNPSVTPMSLDSQGKWRCELVLPPGFHEYKFVVDGRWCCDGGVDGPYDGHPGQVSNDFGTANMVVEVLDPHAPRT